MVAATPEPRRFFFFIYTQMSIACVIKNDFLRYTNVINKKIMDTKVVWKKDVECNGVIYHTSVTKPIEYGEKKWQIALHVKVEGLTLHDYSTHFVEGAGAWDGEVLNQQVVSIYGRLIHKLPKLNESHTVWYRKMTMDYFKGERFEFD